MRNRSKLRRTPNFILPKNSDLQLDNSCNSHSLVNLPLPTVASTHNCPATNQTPHCTPADSHPDQPAAANISGTVHKMPHNSSSKTPGTSPEPSLFSYTVVISKRNFLSYRLSTLCNLSQAQETCAPGRATARIDKGSRIQKSFHKIPLNTLLIMPSNSQYALLSNITNREHLKHNPHIHKSLITKPTTLLMYPTYYLTMCSPLNLTLLICTEKPTMATSNTPPAADSYTHMPPEGMDIDDTGAQSNKRTTRSQSDLQLKKARGSPPAKITPPSQDIWLGFPTMELLAYEAGMPPILPTNSIPDLIAAGFLKHKVVELLSARHSFPRVAQKLWPIDRPEKIEGQHHNVT